MMTLQTGIARDHQRGRHARPEPGPQDGAATAPDDGAAHGPLPTAGAHADPGAPAPAHGGDRPYLPWRGKATRTDKALLGTILAFFAVLLLMWPLKPFLIAANPVLMEFVNGSKAAIGAAAAFARIGEVPLWLVVLAGVTGIAKFDWLFWWTGRRWGRGVIDFFAQTEQAQRLVERAQHANPWWIRAAVALAWLPGVPGIAVYAVAGWTGMRLRTFLVLDLLGALIVTSVIAGLGYALGQYAVDIVLAIDDKAVWVSLAIALGLPLIPFLKRLHPARS